MLQGKKTEEGNTGRFFMSVNSKYATFFTRAAGFISSFFE